MPEAWTDPASVEGDALTQWYLRSPADIERVRQAAAARRYQDFFYGGAVADPGFGRGVPASSRDIDPSCGTPSSGVPQYVGEGSPGGRIPPVGGKSGSKIMWDKHYDRYPGSREEAMEILRRVSREFDEIYGTNISSKLPPASNGSEIGTPPPD